MRLHAVARVTGLSRATIYRKLHSGGFPKPVRLGPNSVGWIAAEVDAWLEELCAERDRASASDTAAA